ncbi:TetR/AcrR family transcriptional regulator [Luteipulveratus mongoliensis]|uniref:HTH tetR-type domain-containing protein n=1 Tax=Luteipulveratus mongoliensis TaxID=571913 RepID=A0A0K1JRB8_9MICO|nr:TetR/AcrR family transcriptional regulator [Luteipulveratus mongoliensis]AKU19269.1 hypothetical protein VV02_24215 [Luteipulveratus mongoliensis]
MTERRYAGRTADERSTERRERLHAAAIELFSQDGYAPTTISRLCALSNVSTRHFYEQYPGKEDLLIDLYTRLTTESLINVGESLASTQGAPALERIPAAIRAYLANPLQDPRVANVAFVAVVGVSPRVEELRLSFRAGIVETFERETADAVESGELPRQDYRFVALAVIGAANVVVHDWSLRHDGDPERVMDQLCDLAVTIALGRQTA